MTKGFTLTETDFGTKETAKRALARTSKALARKFIEKAKQYWWAVHQTARRLCMEMGAVDTWTLYESIRLIWQYEASGGVYEVSISSTGVDLIAMIKAGGGTFINPKTGRVVDYAQAVHDGVPSKGIPPRPFLWLAIAECEPLLQELITQGVDEALMEFARD